MENPGERSAVSSRQPPSCTHEQLSVFLTRKELKYQAASGIQSQIISLLSYCGQMLFRASTGHYNTPHSGRNFMPTATVILGFTRSDRDMPGGWSAEGSERYSRAAKHKISTMQRAVSQSFMSPEPDPLAEADDIDGLGNFLKSWEVPDQEVLRVKTLLVSRTFTDVARDDTPEVPTVQFELAPKAVGPR